MSDYIFKIVADIKQSTKAVEDFSKETLATTKKIQSDFSGLGDTISSGLKTAFVSLGATAASALAGFTLRAAINEAVEYQADLKQLQVALQATGQGAERTVASFEDFAAGLQATTKFSDNAVITTASLIQNLGQLAGTELKQATKAALDLSTALGIDLNSAATLVGKAANGNIAAFARYGIEIRKGANDTETFANAMQALNSRFGGASEKSLDTYAGSIAQVKNNFADLLKEIGLVIINNERVIGATKETAAALGELASATSKNKGSLDALVTSFFEFGDTLIRAATAVSNFLNKFQFGPSVSEVVDANIRLNKTFESQKDSLIEASNAAKAYRKNLGDVQIAKDIQVKKDIAAAVELNDGLLKQVEQQLKDAGRSQYRIIVDQRAEQLKVIQSAERFGTITTKRANELRLAAQGEFQKKSAELDERNRKELLAQQQQQLEKEKQLAETVKAASSSIDGFLANFQEIKNNFGSQGSFLTGLGALASTVKEGAEGARKAVVSVLTAGATALLGPIGQALGPVFDLLSQGPQKVREFFTAFINGVPLIIENIILSIPVLIQALVNSIPQLIDGLLASIPTLIQGLIDSIPLLIESIVLQLPRIIDAFIANLPKIIAALVAAAPQIAAGLARAMPQVALEFMNSLVSQAGRIISAIADGVKEAIKGVTGGIGGAIGKIGGGVKKAFGFAQGGVIPPGYPNDTFPAQLTSGEGVVKNDTMARLDRFLMNAMTSGGANGGGTTTIINKMMIGEQEFAQAILNLNRQGLRMTV